VGAVGPPVSATSSDRSCRRVARPEGATVGLPLRHRATAPHLEISSADLSRSPATEEGNNLDVDRQRLAGLAQGATESFHAGHATGSHSVRPRHIEQDCRTRIDRVRAMAQAGNRRRVTRASPTTRRADSSSETDSALARSTTAAIISMQADPAPPCSSPMARIPAATAADSDCRFPEAARRAVAHEGAPDP